MALPDKPNKTSWMLILASTAIVVTALYLAKGLLIPVTLAVLLSFLLSPVCNWLEGWKLGRIPAVLVTAVLGFTLLGAVAWVAVDQTSRLAPKIPEYRENIKAKLNSVNRYAVGMAGNVNKVGALTRIVVPYSTCRSPNTAHAVIQGRISTGLLSFRLHEVSP
jgi:predicted PurR-regulated permease PerM